MYGLLAALPLAKLYQSTSRPAEAHAVLASDSLCPLESEGQPLVDPLQGAFEVPLLGFEPGEQTLVEWYFVPNCVRRNSPSQVRDARLTVAEPSAS